MARSTLELSAPLYDYYQKIGFRESEILRELRLETAKLPMGKMQTAPEQAQFMALLVQLMGAKRILEIGVFTGYSSLAMALVLPDSGQIIACDSSTEYTAIAERYWQKAGVRNKIQLHLAIALETLEKLLQSEPKQEFDLVFIDAAKKEYDQYYEYSLKLVRPGGLILIDNVLWYGKVADNLIQDNATKSLRNLNQKLHQDSRIELSLIPIGDGLTLALKK